ncbi:Rho-type GTPase activating protein, putative [Entamoeba invadens IP1]|uniref:Rho-type GTPase activating protein, putative n=1 Tax=Entamoeba invadens IP1 TaxID=370355 RepID=L7FKG4_ENTIV|nr:Rho-type GTPase activating protein, putative [Entamoeba invadens IP1]ELP84897.1 Rho-type GTPase activating protein, putative [Entamoeba invadens IP1]|eukprot:XP_004184243.1 Rho-type GTPase activating protein, putative [Entamoeba invadens IP1]
MSALRIPSILHYLDHSNKLVKKVVRIEHNGSTPLLFVGSKIVLDLQSSVMLVSFESIFLSHDQMRLAFKIVYDKEYIFVAMNKVEAAFWYKAIAPLTHPYGVFGYPLEIAVKKSGWRVPLVVYRAVEFLRTTKGYEQEGIFRMNGSVAELKVLREMADQDKDFIINPKQDSIMIGHFLKYYLNQMVEPVIPYEKATQFSQLTSNENPKAFIMSLSTETQDTLCYLLKFLREVAQCSQKNKMTFQNLSLCFALAICREETNDKNEQMLFPSHVINSLSLLLNSFNTVFDEIIERNERFGNEPPKYPAFQPMALFPLNMVLSTNRTPITKQRLSTMVRPPHDPRKDKLRPQSTFSKFVKRISMSFTDYHSKSLAGSPETK